MTPSTLTPNPETFRSLTELRIAHSELLKCYRQNDLTPELLTEVETFLLRGRATGALLDVDDDRWAAQSLLDYWTSILYRQGQEAPDATLLEFDPSQAPELPDDVCPYLGLEAFHEENYTLFYGRQRLLNQLLNHLRKNHFLAVIGSSGSGKSSVVLGGLMPNLKAGALPESETWQYYTPIVPGSHPLKNLARTLCSDRENISSWVSQQSAEFKASPEHLLTLLDAGSSEPGVLVIDQFEETFTLCPDDQIRQAFIDNLLGVIQSPESRHVVIVTMRTDFESRVALYANLQQAFEGGQVRVTPMDARELREAIEKPAESIGLKFEEGLVERLLEDVLGEPAALPLLQFTLLKLWDNRERNRVTLETYERLGGARSALSHSADQLYNTLIPEDQIAAKRILLKMVRPTEGLEVTSNRIPRQSLYQQGEANDRIDRVLEKLIEARLVRLTEGEKLEDAQVEVAHEALVRNWPRLVEWLEDERVNLRHRWRLTSAANQWQERDRDRSVLWRGGLLQDARSYEDLSELEEEFVEQSLKVEREEREEEFATERRLYKTQLMAAIMGIVAVAGIATTTFVLMTRNAVINEIQTLERDASASWYAEKQQLESLLKAARAEKLLQQNLLLKIWPPEPGLTQRVRSTLSYIFYHMKERRRLWHDGTIWSAEFSPDGNLIVTASNDGTVRVWNRQGEIIDELREHGDVRSAKFSPNGELVVTASLDETARIWDFKNSKSVVLQHEGRVWNAEFNPNNSLVVTASGDGTAKVWNLEGVVVATLNHSDDVRNAKFSPNGQFIVTASSDGVAKVWSKEGQQLAELNGHEDQVVGVQFSPDNNWIVTASYDGTSRVWTLQGELVAKLEGHQDRVHTVEVSSNGEYILTVSEDKTAKVWNLKGEEIDQIPRRVNNKAVFSPNSQYIATISENETVHIWTFQGGTIQEEPTTTFEGNKDALWDVQFSPDGDFILTASRDKTARVWSIQDLITKFKEQRQYFWDVEFSPNGKSILTASEDQTARLWDIAGKQLATMQHEGEVFSASFNLSGNLIVTASEDQTARIWNLQGEKLAVLHHANWVNNAQFSPNGNLIVTASRDKTARIWNLQGEQIVELQGHQGSVLDAEFSPSGNLIVTASEDKTAWIWNLQGEQIVELQGHQGTVRDVEFSSNGNLIATASLDETVRIWNLQGEQIVELQGHERGVESIEFIANGQLIVTASLDRTVRIWNLQGEQLATLKHEDLVLDADLSFDGKQLITISWDKTVRVWQFFEWGNPLLLVCESRIDGFSYYLNNNPNIDEVDREICSEPESFSSFPPENSPGER